MVILLPVSTAVWVPMVIFLPVSITVWFLPVSIIVWIPEVVFNTVWMFGVLSFPASATELLFFIFVLLISNFSSWDFLIGSWTGS